MLISVPQGPSPPNGSCPPKVVGHLGFFSTTFHSSLTHTPSCIPARHSTVTVPSPPWGRPPRATPIHHTRGMPHLYGSFEKGSTFFFRGIYNCALCVGVSHDYTTIIISEERSLFFGPFFWDHVLCDILSQIPSQFSGPLYMGSNHTHESMYRFFWSPPSSYKTLFEELGREPWVPSSRHRHITFFSRTPPPRRWRGGVRKI